MIFTDAVFESFWPVRLVKTSTSVSQWVQTLGHRAPLQTLLAGRKKKKESYYCIMFLVFLPDKISYWFHNHLFPLLCRLCFKTVGANALFWATIQLDGKTKLCLLLFKYNYHTQVLEIWLSINIKKSATVVPFLVFLFFCF